MTERTQVPAERRDEEMAEVAATDAEAAAARRTEAEEKIADADALLDEIDELLADQGLGEEAEAAAFVSSYLQSGGQ